MRHAGRLAALLVAFAMLAAVPAAQIAMPSPTGSVSGRVIDAVTHRPVAGASVQLAQVPDLAQTWAADAEYPVFDPPSRHYEPVLTDAKGAFAFDGVAAGAYEVSVIKQGFITTGPWQFDESRPWMPLAAGQHISGLDVPLRRPAFVSGHALDERGAPLSGIWISAISTANPSDFNVQAVITDDRGAFLLALDPGDYTIAALLRPSAPAPALNGHPRVYWTTFYPQAASRDTAVRLTVAAGDERDHIDIVVRAVPVFRVTGRLEGSAGRPGLSMQLNRMHPSDDARGQAIGGVPVDSDGRFAFAAVPPGAYIVRLMKTPEMPRAMHGPVLLPRLPDEPTLWAEGSVTVQDRDVETVIDLNAGSRLSGRVEFDRTGEPPSLEILNQRAILIQRCDGLQVDVRGLYLPDGRFTTIQMPPGRYVVQPQAPPGWHVASLTVGGRDVRDGPVEIARADTTDAVMTFTDRMGTLSGQVTRNPPLDTTRGWVSAFAADRQSGNDCRPAPQWAAAAQLGRLGTYRFDLPRGTYVVVATDTQLSGLATPEAITALLKSAPRVTVIDGQTSTQDLRLQRVRR